MPEGLKLRRGSRLELSYVHGGEVIFQPGGVLGPRLLRDFELVYVIEGWVVYQSGDACHTVPPGGFVFGLPGSRETYHWDPQVPTRHAYFHFGINTIPSDWPDPAAWPRVRTLLSPVCTGLFRQVIQHIYQHDDWPAAKPEPRDCRLVEALLDSFFEEFRGETLSIDRDRPEPVRRALMLMRRVVEEDPLRPLTLADVAKEAHVTEKHVCRLFSRSLGHSPMQTLALMKLQTARPLLVRTNLTVKEIAERCGFENQLYFSRRFSQVHGCSPSAYREQLRNGGMVALKNPLPADVIPRIRW